MLHFPTNLPEILVVKFNILGCFLEIIVDAIRDFQVKDLVDIFVVSTVIYQILRILHGTRSMQVVVGIVLLGIISWMGTSYQLYSINWLLENFFDSFIIILVILFQEEIRSALVSFANRQSFFRQLKSDDREEDINELVDGVWALKNNKCGALIVLKNHNALGEIIESGISLNSNIHREVFLAIFKSPGSIHDGAVVVDKREIIAAGCFLPLAKNADLSRSLGTRHRAGIGVTEGRDSLAVVVSEETHKVSLCISGKIVEIEDPFSLRRYLTFLWGTGNQIDEILPRTYGDVENE